MAFIVAGGNLTQGTLIEYLRANLAPYKVPLKVIFREELPRNATGKILKRQLAQEIKELFS